MNVKEFIEVNPEETQLLKQMIRHEKKMRNLSCNAYEKWGYHNQMVAWLEELEQLREENRKLKKLIEMQR